MDAVVARAATGDGAPGHRPLLASVVVPAYNAAGTVGRCLRALARQTLPVGSYEVIVVDDGSTDGTVAAIEANGDGAVLLRQAHAGPAAARNLGAARARADIVLFTDADCVPAEDWAEQLLAAFQDPEVVGAKGVYFGREGTLVERFVQLEYEDKYERMARRRYIDFIDTYCAAYRRQVLLSVGGFDTSIMAGEDQELSFRLAEAGHKMVFAPQARVRHLGHTRSAYAYWRKKLKIGYWKVRVHDRHPDKLVSDSHTPQVMKLQIGLVALLGGAAAGGLFIPALRKAPWLVGAAFLATTVPFARRAWAKQRLVAVAAPVLLFVRALALGCGFALGLIDRLWPGGPRRARL
ncbi:MAG: glycosyltransferase family 2 protein [Anaerolineae bacterium]